MNRSNFKTPNYVIVSVIQFLSLSVSLMGPSIFLGCKFSNILDLCYRIRDIPETWKVKKNFKNIIKNT